MTILDTHVWIWWVSAPKRLSARAAHAIDQADEIGICAISCWELAMWVRAGRVELVGFDTLAWLRQALSLPRVTLLPLTPEIAVASADLGRDFQGDPADRMIAATAIGQKASLVTKDRRLRSFTPLETVW